MGPYKAEGNQNRGVVTRLTELVQPIRSLWTMVQYRAAVELTRFMAQNVKNEVSNAVRNRANSLGPSRNEYLGNKLDLEDTYIQNFPGKLQLGKEGGRCIFLTLSANHMSQFTVCFHQIPTSICSSST